MTKHKTALIVIIAVITLALYACSDGAALTPYTPDAESVAIYSLESLFSDEKTTVDDSLVLINSTHKTDPTREFTISEYINAAGEATDVYMNDIVKTSYASLSAALKSKFGTKLYISDAYRSYDEQVAIYDEQGDATAAKPGYSEHQTGLALDVYVAYYAGAGFVNCKEGRWVNKNCGDYGFIIRYPDGKEGETGFAYEPWHLRYVGQPHSSIMSDRGYTLEHYLEMLSGGDGFTCEDYIIITVPTESEYVTAPAAYSSLTASDTGCGYYVLTFKI